MKTVKFALKTLICIAIVVMLCGGGYLAVKLIEVQSREIEFEARAKNVIFMVGDGMGPEHVLAGTLYKGSELSMINRINCGTVSTWSLMGLTDSAAAATAMATGAKTYNTAIGQLLINFTNLTEYASGVNRKTGVISTKNVTDATPAAFTVHNFMRINEKQIAKDQIAADYIDLLIGYGREYFDPYADKINTANRAYVNTPEGVLAADKSRVYGIMDGDFSLAEMTDYALNKLENENGFFLMVEGAKIDSRSHSNDFAGMIKEIMGFDEAVAVAKDYVINHPDTLLIITADHETGGLRIPAGATFAELGNGNFHTGGHTNTNVPFYAYGVGANLIPASLDNTDWYDIVTKALRN